MSKSESNAKNNQNIKVPKDNSKYVTLVVLMSSIGSNVNRVSIRERMWDRELFF